MSRWLVTPTSSFLILSWCLIIAATNGAGQLGEAKASQVPVIKEKQQKLAEAIPSNFSVGILKLRQIAQLHGIADCSLGDILVDSGTQVPRLVEDMWGLFDKGVYYQPTTHHASANATPWTFLEHLQHMPWYTDKVEEASIIMVDDYCYKMWAIAQTHSLKDRVRNPEDADETPMYILMKLYKQLIESELFQVRGASAFAFFQPHTGFAKGPIGTHYEHLLCEELIDSFHLVNTRGQRLRCDKYLPGNFAIVPGSVSMQDLADIWQAEMSRPRPAAVQAKRHKTWVQRLLPRRSLLFFKGKCSPLYFAWGDRRPIVGKTMRFSIVQELQQLHRIPMDVTCTGDSLLLGKVAAETSHFEVTRKFLSSRFCLMIPGDSQTSRRLPEALLAGCIPVFPGPPYHTVPFVGLVDMLQIALFFNITQAPWLASSNISVHWQADEIIRPDSPNDGNWWIPDIAGIQQRAISVRSIPNMVDYLLRMSDAEVAQRTEQVIKLGTQLLWTSKPVPGRPTATDFAVQALYTFWQQQQGKGRQWTPQQGRAKSLQAWLQPTQRAQQPVSEWTVYAFEAVMDPDMTAHHASFVANQSQWRTTLNQAGGARRAAVRMSRSGRRLERVFRRRRAAQRAAGKELKGRVARRPPPRQRKPERFSLAKAWQEDVSRLAAAPDALHELASENQVSQWHGKRNWEFKAPWHKQRQAHLQRLALQP